MAPRSNSSSWPPRLLATSTEAVSTMPSGLRPPVRAAALATEIVPRLVLTSQTGT